MSRYMACLALIIIYYQLFKTDYQALIVDFNFIIKGKKI